MAQHTGQDKLHTSSSVQAGTAHRTAERQQAACDTGQTPCSYPEPGTRAQPKATHKDLAGVAVAQRQSGVRDQVRQAVGAAQQARLGVVGKARLGALHGGLEGQSGRAVGVVLHARWQNTGKCACVHGTHGRGGPLAAAAPCHASSMASAELLEQAASELLGQAEGGMLQSGQQSALPDRRAPSPSAAAPARARPLPAASSFCSLAGCNAVKDRGDARRAAGLLRLRCSLQNSDATTTIHPPVPPWRHSKRCGLSPTRRLANNCNCS